MEALAEPMFSADPFDYHQGLVERLDILRKNHSFCDVKVVVKDKELPAHKAVLAAASPFFLSLLTSDMRESKEHLIRIELEEATVSVMEDALEYIYTGNVSVTEENAHNLIATADYLLVPGLKTVVGRYLMEVLTTDDRFFNYYFADKYQCEELKEGAREMINSDFSAVMETDEFLGLDIKQVMEWVSSDDITVNAEEEVFKGIVKWVSHRRSEREVEFPSLLCQVRLVSISHNFLLNELVKEELVAKNNVCLSFVLDGMRLTASATDEQTVQQPRKCLKMNVDAIFVCGGSRALCYVPKQNVWYKLSDMLFQHGHRSNPSQCGGKIYIPCQRSDQLGGSSLMECYTPATNSWAAFQVVTTFTCTAVLKGHLYASDESEIYCETYMYRYDPEKNCSYKLEKLLISHHKACVLTDEKHLYLIGGADGRGAALSTTYRCDPTVDDHEWEEVAPMNQARCDAFGAAMNGKVYIAGGCQGQITLNGCEVYNPVTNEWQLMPSLKVPRMSASMVYFEERLYVLGGVSYSHLPPSQVLSVETFDSEWNIWREKSHIPVNSFETSEEKEKNKFRACFAILRKEVIDKVVPPLREPGPFTFSFPVGSFSFGSAFYNC